MSTILLVDDEPGIRLSLSEILKDAGHTVSTAENGRIALEMLAKEPFAILLTDISMPVMGGIELAREVRSGYPDTLIILFTGQGTLENATQALHIGVFDYLLKPVKKDDLLKSIARAERIRKLNRLNRKLFEENEQYRLELEERIREQSLRLTRFSELLLTVQDRLRASILPDIRELVHRPVREAFELLKKIEKPSPDVRAFREEIAEFLASSLDPFKTDNPFNNPEASLEGIIREFAAPYCRDNRTITVSRLNEPADNKAGTHVYYAVREALTNAIRHSGGDNITVDCEQTNESLVYHVSDNGHGFSGEQISGNRGIGLLLMKERAEMAGGTFKLITQENSGTRISISVPRTLDAPEKNGKRSEDG